MAMTFLTNEDELRFQHRLVGNGAPTTETVAAIGEQYMDVDTGATYKCTNVDNGVYTWEINNNDTAVSVGKNINGGEIFNDYENNTIENEDYTNCYAHAEGCKTTAGWRSHAEGYMTVATSTSHAEGRLTQATGKGSHAEGFEVTQDVANVFTFDAVHIDNNVIKVSNLDDNLQIGDTVYLTTSDSATGFDSTDVKRIVGIDINQDTISIPTNQNRIGKECFYIYPSDYVGISEGDCVSFGSDASMDGHKITKVSFDENFNWFVITFDGEYEPVDDDVADGDFYTGDDTATVNRTYTVLTLHAPFRAENYYEGNGAPEDGYIPAGAKLRQAIGTKATNIASHAEGAGTSASGKYSHTEGYKTEANADCAHAEGNRTIASAIYAHAEGNQTHATGKASHIEGRYNVIDNSGIDSGGYRKYVHIVGNGSSDTSRSNAHTLDWKGNAWYAGSIRIGGTSFDEGAEEIATKEYVSKNQVGVKNSNGGESFNNNNAATGTNSHAEGVETAAIGGRSHTEGYKTKTYGWNSHAEGVGSTTGDVNDGNKGTNAHAEGYYTTAYGNASHAEGRGTIAKAANQHVQGKYNIEDTVDSNGNGAYAHIVGNGTESAPSNAHTLDWSGNAWFAGNVTASNGQLISTSEVNSLVSNKMDNKNPVGTGSFSLNRKENTTIGDYSVAIGKNTKASGKYSHTEGYNTEASADCAHAEGNQTVASEAYSHAEGSMTTASGKYSHSEGSNTEAIGSASHAEGYKSTASGNYSHAEGSKTTASGSHCHAEGYETIASGRQSHAEGYMATASGETSHAEGQGAIASGRFSHAEGWCTEATNDCQHVQGRYNEIDIDGKYAHIVGWGFDSYNKKNIHTVSRNGDGAFAGSVSSTTGADYAEYFEWEDGNLENEDRVGYVVTLNGDKIRFATAQDDDVLGIVSGTAAVIGDTAEYEWCNKNLTDEFGRVITERTELFEEIIDPETEEVTKISLGFFDVPKLNPEYDSTKEYVRRDKRPEWACIGMFGKLYVRDDGTCQVNGYAKVGEDGKLTASDTKTNMRVLVRTSENIVRILLK